MNVVRRLVELLMHPVPAVQIPALRTIGNIVTGNDDQTQVVLRYGALPSLHMLLSSPRKSIRKETCWTLSNITAGNRDQIQVYSKKLHGDEAENASRTSISLKQETTFRFPSLLLLPNRRLSSTKALYRCS